MQIQFEVTRDTEIGTIALVVAAALAGFFMLVALLWWLWNITVPDVFRLPKITYWQALRLLLIFTILFGGILS